MSAIQIKNRFILLSGFSKSIGANSNSFQKAITLKSANSFKKRINGIIVRFKPGLEDVGFELESKNNRNLIKGYLPLSVIGAPYGTAGFHCFPFFGRKPMILGEEVIEIKLQTQGTVINSKDVSVTLLVEEVVNEDPEYAKKNPFALLCGSTDPVLANLNEQTGIILPNSFSSEILVHGWVLRYKPTLDNVIIDLFSTATQRSGAIIEGEMTLAIAGAIHGSPAFDFFPIPGKKPILGKKDEIKVLLSTNSVPILARDIGIALIVEEI